MSTFPLNVLFALLCGACLGVCAGPQPGLPWRRLLPLPVLFALLPVLPAAWYLALQFPDWTLSYLVDLRSVLGSRWRFGLWIWSATAAILTAGAVIAGFTLWVNAARRHGGSHPDPHPDPHLHLHLHDDRPSARRPRLLLALLAGAFVYLVVLALTWRSGRLAQPDQLNQLKTLGPLEANAQIAIGYPLLAINLGIAVALAYVGRTLRAKGEFLFFAAPAAQSGSRSGPKSKPSPKPYPKLYPKL